MRIGQRHARLYGVGSYPDMPPEWAMAAAHANVERLGGELKRWGFANPQKVSDPVKEQILHHLAVDAAVVGEDDVYLLYLTGHSFPGESVADIFFAAGDFRDKERPHRFGLPLRDLVEAVRRIRARVLVVILDSCYSGGAHHVPESPKNNRNREFALLTSSRLTPSYLSPEDGGEPLSVYARAILDSLAAIDRGWRKNREVSVSAFADALMSTMCERSEAQLPTHHVLNSRSLPFLQRVIEPGTAEVPSQGGLAATRPAAGASPAPAFDEPRRDPRAKLRTAAHRVSRWSARVAPTAGDRVARAFPARTENPPAQEDGGDREPAVRPAATPVPREPAPTPAPASAPLDAPGWTVEWTRDVVDRPNPIEDDPVWALRGITLDGVSLLLVADTNGGLRLWPADGRGDPLTVGRHDGPIRRLVHHERHRLPLAATVGEDDLLRVWHLRERRLARVLRGHRGPILSASMYEHGRDLVALTGSEDGTAILWDVPSSSRRHVLRGHDGPVWTATLTVLGGEPTAVTTGGDGTVRLWRVRDGECLTVLRGHGARVYAVSLVERDGRPLLVTGDDDGAVIGWDLDAAGPRFRRQAHDAAVHTVALRDVDGATIAVTTGDRRARVWDAANGRLRHDLAGHRGDTWLVAFARLDGREVTVTADLDEEIRFWGTDGAPLDRLRLPQRCGLFDVTSDGTLAVAYGSRLALLRPNGRVLRRHET